MLGDLLSKKGSVAVFGSIFLILAIAVVLNSIRDDELPL
jgi:hypothetical protein